MLTKTLIVNKQEMIVRPMTVSDVPVVAAISQEEKNSSWPKNLFYDCLKEDYLPLVITKGDSGLANHTIGFIVLLNQVGESQLIKMAVRKSCYRQGIGKALLRHAITLAGIQHLKHMTLEVRVSNQAAIALYESCDFSVIATRRDYYPLDDAREDALVMRRVF